MSLTEQQARTNLDVLVEDYLKLSPQEKENASESGVLVYVERLFRDVLGWPTQDITKFQHEKSVVLRKRVDRILNLDNGEKIYVEAKRFGLIDRLSNSNEWSMGPGQLSLPGMATDRTQEEQQAINYAFENGGTWAILSNFERFRLFNARRDWLVLAFEAPAAYKEDFDLLWKLSWQNIHNGELERLNSQRVTKDLDSDYLSIINEQREKLAVDITLNPERNPWAFDRDGTLRLGLLRAVVQRMLDRLVIVRFAEDHYVIPPGTLKQYYELRKNSPYTNELHYYLQDFFHHFDRQHNSALFAQSEVDEARFSDEVLLPLIDKLYEARFRAMPADIIGNTYEQYLGKTLVLEDGVVTIQDNLETRKAQGSYYTPQYIVGYIVDHTLGRYLYGTRNGKPNGIRIPGQTRKNSADIRELRVLDSACGSGSFLIYAYEVLAGFYKFEVKRLTEEFDQKVKDIAARFASATLDDRVEAQRIEDERDFIRDNYRRLILENHLYGTDLDPQAAEIAVMNLILRALEGIGTRRTLPLILNQNIKVGNSLIGLRPDDPRLLEYADTLAVIRRLRVELVNTSHLDPCHSDILSELTTGTDNLYQRFRQDCTSRNINPERSRPFHWAIEFPEVFVDENGRPLDNPGFHFIFGNPPYGAKLSQAERNYYKREYNIGMTNTAGLFMSQSGRLLRGDGGHGFIVPKSFLYASNWRKLRERLLDGLEVLADVGRGWDDVLLEQVVYIHRKGEKTHHYRNLKRDKQGFQFVGNVDKRECCRFGFFVNDIAESELQVAHQIRKNGILLGEYTTVSSGGDLQNQLSGIKKEFSVIGGANVQRYYMRGVKGYCDADIVSDKSVIQAGDLLVQDILAFIENPMRHIKITAHLVQEEECNLLILNTINRIEITSDDLSSQFVLAILNSKLINWYVYRFIFSKPIRTMHFNRLIISRIPLPNFTERPDLVAQIITEIKHIYANRHANEKPSQKRIDELIYQLYDLSTGQIALVEANMP